MDSERIRFLENSAMVFAALGILLYEEPAAERLEAFLEAGFYTDQPFAQDEQAIAQGTEMLAAWAAAAQEKGLQEMVDQLSVEWLKLFVGVGDPLAAPWASYYLERDAILFGKWTLEVRSWYARYNLVLEKKNNEPDDHLGLMLQFFSMLISRECEAGKDGNEEGAEKYAVEQEEFLLRFIHPWIALWLGKVSSAQVSGYYKGLALLTGGMLALYSSESGFDVSRAKQGIRNQKSVQ